MWGDLTRHVHHPTVAHPQDLIGLTEQATGTDAVCVVSWELLFAGRAAVPPGLGQVGQLNTQRFIRPQSKPAGVSCCRVHTNSGSWDEEDLPSAPDMKQRSGSPERPRSPAGGCREAHPDCGSELGCRPPGTSHLQDETVHEHGALFKGKVQGNFRVLPHLTAWTQFEANRKPYFSHVWKISQYGLILCDNYNARTNLRQCILFRNFLLRITFFTLLECNQNMYYLQYMTQRNWCMLYLFLHKAQQRYLML